MRFLGIVVRGVVVAVATAAVVIMAAITIGRAVYLPTTVCGVSASAVEGVALMQPYDAVRQHLGCEGVLVSRRNLGPVVEEVYKWRGDVWPFGMLEGRFYDGTLHRKDVRWLDLTLTLPPLGWPARTSAPPPPVR